MITKEELMASEAESYLAVFKEDMKKICDQVLSKVYVELVPHIESDAWVNYRNDLREALASEYSQDEFLRDEHLWAREFRQKILKEHREALIDGLNQDLVAQVARLEERLNQCRERSW